MIKPKLSTVLVFTLLLSLLTFSTTAYAQPGTPEDPLVSRSYVESRIAELEAVIAQLTALIAMFGEKGETGEAGVTVPDPPGLPETPVTTPTVTRELFIVVRAEPGMLLIGEASTEIILRAGEATVVAGANGLANVTAGADIMNGQRVQLNHLLIVPQSDGRGLRFHTTAYLMIKGDFHIISG